LAISTTSVSKGDWGVVIRLLIGCCGAAFGAGTALECTGHERAPTRT